MKKTYMDTNLLNLVSAKRPRMDHKVCTGVGYHQSKLVEEYINNVWRSAAESFGPSLKYVDYVRCTPEEQFTELTRPSKPRKAFELSRSDIYMVKYMFRFTDPDGVEHSLRPRYIMLPFVSPGGLIHLKGTQYKVTPVLNSQVFNIEKGNVFIATPRTPIVISKVPMSFKEDGRQIHTTILYSNLYNMLKSERSKYNPTLIHYMLSTYGVTEMFKHFFNTEVKIGGPELDDLIGGGLWKVYMSSQIPLRGRKDGIVPVIRIAVLEGSQSIPNSVIGALGAVFYIADVCPESIYAEDMDDPSLWLRLLSRFIFKNPEGDARRYEEMETHLDSVIHNMDPITRRMLLGIDIECETIFDLFKYMIENFHDMVMYHDVGSMYNMELTTVKHLLYHVVHNIFTCTYELKKLQGERLTLEKITRTMDNTLGQDRILTTKKHGELSTESIATDCMPYSATCNMVSQTKAAMAGSGSRSSKTGVADLLHSSQVEVGSYGMMSKAEPTSRGKANPFMFFSRGFIIGERPELKTKIDNLSQMLKRI